MEQEHSTCQYTALDEAKRQIRLLHLLPSVDTDVEETYRVGEEATSDIHCTFSLVSLNDDLSYEALSYVWGDPTITTPVTVHDHTFPVTSNLHSALRHLRYADKERVLWVDALCIDQSNVKERSSQVSQMHHIYSRARQVTIFLGEAWKNCDSLIDLLEFVASHQHLHFASSSGQSIQAHGFDIHSEPVLDSIATFFTLPWWTRVWTVQEYILAKQPVFVLGHRMMTDLILRRFIKHIRLHNSCCSIFDGVVSAGSPTFRLINGMHGIYVLQYLANPDALKELLLMDVLATFRSRNCSNPSDKIYGMLGIADDASRALVPIDYTRPPRDVYTDLTFVCILESRTLDCLSLIWGTRKKGLNLPSFVINLDSSVGDFENTLYFGRLEATLHTFSAGRDSEAKFVRDRSDEATTHAVVFDTIGSAVHPPKKNRDCAGACWKMLTSPELPASPYVSRAEAFWRTFCGGCGALPPTSEGTWFKPIQDSDMHAFERWLAWMGSEDSTRTITTADNAVDAFSRAFVIVSMGRKFAMTSKGFIGWVPRETRTGDVVAVMSGGKVPYVLRRASQTGRTTASAGSSSDTRCYRFIGDAYIHGIMYGEAYDEAKLETITLV